LLGRRVDGVGGRLGMPALLVAGGLAVGALALAADALGADSQDVLFSGQASIPVVVDADSTKIVVVLIVAKFLAYGISLGCGFRGGPIFPAVFLGVALALLPVVWLRPGSRCRRSTDAWRRRPPPRPPGGVHRVRD
jgi:H+/Cl- antiporter ClcA